MILCSRNMVSNIPVFWDVTVWIGVQEQTFCRSLLLLSSVQSVVVTLLGLPWQMEPTSFLQISVPAYKSMWCHKRRLKSLSAPLREPQVSQICPCSDRHSFLDVCTRSAIVTYSVATANPRRHTHRVSILEGFRRKQWELHMVLFYTVIVPWEF